MKIPFFDITRQNKLLERDYASILQVSLKRGQHILGGEVSAFEQEFAEYTRSSYCVTCGNATDALEMALQAVRVGAGHEVIVPAFGWVSVVSAVLSRGATPVFVDVQHDGNMDPQLIEGKINHKTRAVIPIHLYGHPCEIKEIARVCRKHNLSLIEDCAQAHGARIEDTHVGNFGDIGVFSFYPTKNLGALGDGGALVTNDPNVFNQLMQIRNYGKDVQGDYSGVGRNSRLDELQAAFLRMKLPFLDRWIDQRRAIADQYNQQLGAFIPTQDSVWYKYVLTTSKREEVAKRLNASGIETGIYYPFQLDTLPFFQAKKRPLEIADKLSKTVLSLPLFPEMTNEEITYICNALEKIR